jgi:Caspase domain
MRNCLLIATMLVTAISLPHRAAAQVLSGSDDPLRHGHALLIGNSHYRAWPQLVDVPLQLDELARGLKKHFDTVEVVKDLETDPLRQKINGFLRSYGNDSNARLFIYYAGHGYTETILPYNENRGYITGIDTPVVDGSVRGYNAARPKAMSMMEIRSPLAEVLAKHILVVFDSCFSGTIFTSRGANDPPRMLSPSVVASLMEKMARDIITAGSANERVPAHSPIPKLLLSALNGEADRYRHGVISAADIRAYLRDQVLNLPGVSLTPQQGRLQDPNFAEGEFLFRVSNPNNPVELAGEKEAPKLGDGRLTIPPVVAPTQGNPSFSAWTFRKGDVDNLCSFDRGVGDSDRIPVSLHFKKSEATKPIEIDMKMVLFSNDCDKKYAQAEGTFKLGSETFRSTSSSSMMLDLDLSSPHSGCTSKISTETDLHLFSKKGDNEVRRYVALLVSSKEASFTLTKGSKLIERIVIPLTGIREALQNATCSAINMATYLPAPPVRHVPIGTIPLTPKTESSLKLIPLTPKTGTAK